MREKDDLYNIKSLKSSYAFRLKQQVEYSSSVASSEPNGTAMSSIMEKMAARGALSEIIDPSEWQRDIRKDRLLPFREG